MGGTAHRAELVLKAQQSLQGVSSAGGEAAARAGDNLILYSVTLAFIRLNLFYL